ncbi:hypothetical protein [Streptomyces fructofermentans]|uniref:Uncharacterized protein n=1 Tax=Streptomyces fructofermentans TaxID=152141 RepID=A0A918KQA6_9ACTN|nr:hypothetical protein [Streptomyces fructofermentans]GGX69274.1 hypothetical protein GCM10010515_41070 [Streptomyces fructofermentans]
MTDWAGGGQPRQPRIGESSTVDAARLRRVNRGLAQDLSGKLTDLYVDSHEASSRPDAYCRPSRRQFLNRLTADIRRPGFAMVIAETGGLVGCAFGFPMLSDTFEWIGFDSGRPRGVEQLAAAGGIFAITDILILPHPQDARVALRLQERLLVDQRASIGATLVDRADHPTLNTLRSWGWLDVGAFWKPTGATRLRVLILPSANQHR